MAQTPQNLLSASEVTSSFEAGTLGQRVTNALLKQIKESNLTVGTRLPSEQVMANHFKVSRNIVREAIAQLKSEGILDTRKGSGTFIRKLPAPATDAITAASIESLLDLNEVRGGIEGEIAALAALRRTPGQLQELERALQQIEIAVSQGKDGVEEDFSFHFIVAKATGNSAWIKLVELFSTTIHSAMLVTRANEALHSDFSCEVIQEHRQILDAIIAGDAMLARTAAINHMRQGARRIRDADREFWLGNGGKLARKIDHPEESESL